MDTRIVDLGGPLQITLGTYVTPDHLCPDLLRHEQLGAADDLRGRVVRAFFWIMRAWPTKKRCQG